MQSRVTRKHLESWRINYGLDQRDPLAAAEWWRLHHNNSAPVGTVLALAAALEEIERLWGVIDAASKAISPALAGHDKANPECACALCQVCEEMTLREAE